MESQHGRASCVRRVLALAPGLFATLASVAGDASEAPPVEPGVAEHAEVRLVLVPTVVADRRGAPVLGLAAEDFRLYEDNLPQSIHHFSTDPAESVSLAFLLDLSGSMGQLGKLDEAKEAIRHFAEQLRPADRLALIGFADGQVSWVTEFTADRERFVTRLDVQRAWGKTALYDAVAATPELVDRAAAGRKAIVLITDGLDNASAVTSHASRQLARRVDVPIYVLALSIRSRRAPVPQAEQTTTRILELFAVETGGAMFTLHDPDELKEAVLRIDAELRSGYLLGYQPTRTLWDGSYRRIRLEVPRRRGLEVRTRRGYYATP